MQDELELSKKYYESYINKSTKIIKHKDIENSYLKEKIEQFSKYFSTMTSDALKKSKIIL